MLQEILQFFADGIVEEMEPEVHRRNKFLKKNFNTQRKKIDTKNSQKTVKQSTHRFLGISFKIIGALILLVFLGVFVYLFAKLDHYLFPWADYNPLDYLTKPLPIEKYPFPK